LETTSIHVAAWLGLDAARMNRCRSNTARPMALGKSYGEQARTLNRVSPIRGIWPNRSPTQDERAVCLNCV
jgi:hypothetical protein